MSKQKILLFSFFFLCIILLFNNLNLSLPTKAIDSNQTLIITEIAAFEASNLEWIEVYNNSEDIIDISNLKLLENETNHGITSLSENYLIQPQEFFIIANKAEDLILSYELNSEQSFKVYDSTWSSLNLSGETLSLILNEEVLDSINYGESSQNTSLERSNLSQEFSEFTHHPDSNSILALNSNWSLPEINCEEEPNHPDCQNPELNCQETPENPLCLSQETDCELNPLNPECLNTLNCQESPNHQICLTCPESIHTIEYIENPTLLISEVSFKDSSQDWIEIFLSPNNNLIDLNQYYLKIDNKKIPLGNTSTNEDQLILIEEKLVGTTEEVLLLNPNDEIIDTLCWQNESPTESEQNEIEYLKENSYWLDDCFNSDKISNNSSLARKNFFQNTKSQTDWKLEYHPSPQEFNYQNNQAPLAKITIQSGETEAEEKLSLNLDGSLSSDPDQDELQFTWYLDEEVFSEEENPSSLSIEEIGQHLITLNVSDTYGYNSQASLYLNIKEKITDSVPSQSTASSNNTSSSTEVISSTSQDTPEFVDANIIIHSFLANPSGSDTGQEWIKLQNLDTKNINLENWILDDELSGDSKAYIIPNIELAPQETYTFNNSITGISLKNTSDKIHLLKPDKSIKDQIYYTDLQEDEIILQDPNSKELIRLNPSTETKNTSNSSSSSSSNTSSSSKTASSKTVKYPNGDLNPELKITEVFPNPEGTDKDKEWLELYNPSSKDTNLNNWKILNNTKELLLHDQKIPANSYLKIEIKDFSLGNTSTEIKLQDFENKTIDQISYTKAEENQSYTKLNQEWYWLKTISPGEANPSIITINGQLQNIDLENQTLSILNKENNLYKIQYDDPKILEQFDSNQVYELSLETLKNENSYLLFKILEISKIETEKKPYPPLIPIGLGGLSLIPAYIFKQEIYANLLKLSKKALS